MSEFSAPAGPETEAACRRKFPRELDQKPVTLHALNLPERAYMRVVLSDRGAGGIGFDSAVSFGTGDLYVATLPQAQGPVCLLLCEIRRCQKQAGGGFHIGAQIVETCDGPKIPQAWRARGG